MTKKLELTLADADYAEILDEAEAAGFLSLIHI